MPDEAQYDLKILTTRTRYITAGREARPKAAYWRTILTSPLTEIDATHVISFFWEPKSRTDGVLFVNSASSSSYVDTSAEPIESAVTAHNYDFKAVFIARLQVN